MHVPDVLSIQECLVLHPESTPTLLLLPNTGSGHFPEDPLAPRRKPHPAKTQINARSSKTPYSKAHNVSRGHQARNWECLPLAHHLRCDFDTIMMGQKVNISLNLPSKLPFKGCGRVPNFRVAQGLQVFTLFSSKTRRARRAHGNE